MVSLALVALAGFVGVWLGRRIERAAVSVQLKTLSRSIRDRRRR